MSINWSELYKQDEQRIEELIEPGNGVKCKFYGINGKIGEVQITHWNEEQLDPTRKLIAYFYNDEIYCTHKTPNYRGKFVLYEMDKIERKPKIWVEIKVFQDTPKLDISEVIESFMNKEPFRFSSDDIRRKNSQLSI